MTFRNTMLPVNPRYYMYTMDHSELSDKNYRLSNTIDPENGRHGVIVICNHDNGRFTFERIHNTKEQIYFYERAENHKAKERLFESFK